MLRLHSAFFISHRIFSAVVPPDEWSVSGFPWVRLESLTYQ